ncbi:hypothetical protein Lser_V15G19374 [Lactuca serriola]
MEDLWKQAFPVGTEWHQLDSLSEYKWNFSNLEGAFEEGGVLHGKKVYLFTCTEPQLLSFHDQTKVICISVVVAVVSPFPPSDKIGIQSVYRESEEILDMKQMKMDWVPYIPLGKRGSSIERVKSQIFILNCEFVRERVREGKRANREAREKRKNARVAMSEEKKAAFENIKFYKFYPVTTPDTPDVSNLNLHTLIGTMEKHIKYIDQNTLENATARFL